MSLGMEIMIMVALVMFILTSMFNIGLTMWAIKSYAPIMKLMTKQMKLMYSELEEEEEVGLKRIK